MTGRDIQNLHARRESPLESDQPSTRDHMSEAEQLQQAIAAQENLRGMVPDSVIDATIAALQKQLAELQAATTEQQRKQVTVLFADVAGFTAMSETMDVELVTGVMNEVWEALDAAILAHGGRIDKHIGDALMALWGTDTAHEDDAEEATRAALAMQAALAEFAATNAHPVAMRIGLNTGPVLLGQVGHNQEYTAMGDTVNLASRLETAAAHGTILISHATYNHVRGVFDVNELQPIIVKGKQEPVQVYEVERAKPRAFRMGRRGVEGVDTRMIGRDAELGMLQEAFLDAFAGTETLFLEDIHWADDASLDLIIHLAKAMPAARDLDLDVVMAALLSEAEAGGAESAVAGT